MVRVGLDEILHLHLLKLARTQDKVARRDLVAKRFSNLRDSEWNLAAHRRLHVQEVDENPLGRFRTQIRERSWIVLNGGCAERGPKHHVEKALVREVSRAAISTLNVAAPKPRVRIKGRNTPSLHRLWEISFE